jgi:hypothetical protein
VAAPQTGGAVTDPNAPSSIYGAHENCIENTFILFIPIFISVLFIIFRW